MKRFFTILSVAALFASCLSEDAGDRGRPTTFVRYYYGGYNDKAVAFEETSDKGFILVSTVTISASEAVAAKYKIKLIKTDEFGNPLWQQIYPPFTSTTGDYKAKGIQILQNGGYVITGENIQTKGATTKSKILIMTVDDKGAVIKSQSYLNPQDTTASASGQAVAANAAGNYLVLSTSSSVNTDGDTEMYLEGVKKDDLSQMWTKGYSAGQAILAPRLFLDDVGDVFWAGSVNRNGVAGIRVVKTSQNVQTAIFDQFHINPPFAEEAADFCRFGFGYAIVGSTNQKQGSGTPADKDILFKMLAQNGSVIGSKSFPLDDPARNLVDTQNDQGNSISSTQNGGLILLGTAGSLAINGRGDNDYLLIQINAFGDEIWRSSFGSRFKDQGVAVRQASDGFYMVLGTSTQGGREIMMLAKTNRVGKIE